MDTITHTLAGAVIAKAIDDKNIGKWGTIAGLTVGFFPDSDFVLGLINRQFYLEYHRDFTHSLLLVPFYALFFSWLFVKISQGHHFWSYFKVCLPVLVSHVIFDLLTSYGTMILSPFFGHRFAWDLVFIIDLVFSGILFIPLVVSIFWKGKSQWICRGAAFAIRNLQDRLAGDLLNGRLKRSRQRAIDQRDGNDHRNAQRHAQESQ